MSRWRICIVGPRHLADTPRIVKEADALHDAGFDVRVVCSHGGQEGLPRDHALLSRRSWRWQSIRWSRSDEFLQWLLTAMRQRAFQLLPRSTWPRSRVAEYAEGRVFSELSAAASAEAADLYIGHYAEGLAAAGAAARRWGARLGFDAEDFHTGEGSGEAQTARVDFIQRRYLPHCAHLTAASKGIGDALANRYNVKTPLPIHNVFPWSDRERLDKRVLDRRGPEPSLHWCSLRIGPDRGIQDAIRAAGLLHGPVQIHLRGLVDRATHATLFELAKESGVAERLFFHERVPPTELLSRATEHDIGLALEQGDTVNRSICASNKMFFYMLAGLAVAATDVPGQREVLGEQPSVARLYQPGNIEQLAAYLEVWRSNPDGLARAKRAALESAKKSWNWERESQKLVEQVDQVLGQQSRVLASSHAVSAK